MPRKQHMNYRAKGGRYGPGKVHEASSTYPYSMCGLPIYGDLVPAKDNPVTCKRCQDIATGKRQPTFG